MSDLTTFDQFIYRRIGEGLGPLFPILDGDTFYCYSNGSRSDCVAQLTVVRQVGASGRTAFDIQWKPAIGDKAKVTVTPVTIAELSQVTSWARSVRPTIVATTDNGSQVLADMLAVPPPASS